MADKQSEGQVGTFLGDALGSMRQMVGADGAVQLEKSYEPYGEPLTTLGDGVTRYGFTGGAYDSDIQWLYLRVRYCASYPKAWR